MKQLRTIALFSWKYAYLLLPALGAVLIVYSHVPALKPVLISGGDNLHHYLSQYVIHYSYLAGDNPFGPTNTEFGVPILRFYQVLFYLVSVGIHIVTKADIRLLHNILMVTCFALSPFSYCYFLRKLGLRLWAASIGSLVSIISIAGFGNSFEAYHGCGIVTQSMGALFFPWFMGNCIGMLRGENRVVGTSVLFALAFLSHAIMAVYAVFAGVLYFLVAPVGIARNWKRITAFGLLGAALVAFWVFPFIAHTQEMRAVPDSIIRGHSKRWWFASVSKDEMVESVISGKLFDDPSAYRKDQTDRLDKLVDWMNIARTRHTRPSVVTVLLALGVLASFLSFRRTSSFCSN